MQVSSMYQDIEYSSDLTSAIVGSLKMLLNRVKCNNKPVHQKTVPKGSRNTGDNNAFNTNVTSAKPRIYAKAKIYKTSVADHFRDVMS